jgi:sirohydrochlorin cobaltochelatase
MEYSILLVGHGSRAKQGNVEIEAFADQWRTLHPEWKIDVCFIEFADVLLDAGFDLAAKKSKKVIVVPLILNAAGHVKMEVPEHLVEARKRHPDVEFLYAPHLGANEAILSIMKRSLLKVMAGLDMPDPKSTGVIILGRGSSDKIANGEVAKMARWLWEETQHELVDIAFTGITFPRLETAVQRQVKLGMTQVCVLPYYLFTGTLIVRIDKQVAHLQAQYPQIRFGLGQYNLVLMFMSVAMLLSNLAIMTAITFHHFCGLIFK